MQTLKCFACNKEFLADAVRKIGRNHICAGCADTIAMNSPIFDHVIRQRNYAVRVLRNTMGVLAKVCGWPAFPLGFGGGIDEELKGFDDYLDANATKAIAVEIRK